MIDKAKRTPFSPNSTRMVKDSSNTTMTADNISYHVLCDFVLVDDRNTFNLTVENLNLYQLQKSSEISI